MEERMYIAISRDLEDEIISGMVKEGEAAPSTHVLAARYGINPATVAKGVSRLATAGYLTKRRGVGLFVAPGARDAIIERRRKEFRETLSGVTMAEARKLGIAKTDLVAMIMVSD